MMPRLRAAIPKLASLDIERTLTFFEGLGFKRLGSYPDYGVSERDGVQLHFWLCNDPRIPKETGCRIAVEGIEELYKEFSAHGVVHPNGHLEEKPWGGREFSILDADGNLLTFQQTGGELKGTGYFSRCGRTRSRDRGWLCRGSRVGNKLVSCATLSTGTVLKVSGPSGREQAMKTKSSLSLFSLLKPVSREPGSDLEAAFKMVPLF